jgi:hypothetical protein
MFAKREHTLKGADPVTQREGPAPFPEKIKTAYN